MPLRPARALATTLLVSAASLALAGACAESVAPETWSLSSTSNPASPVVGKPATPAPTVRVTVNGEARDGASVHWSATAGTLSAIESVTDASGTATVSWTLGTVAGPQTLTATGPSGAPPVQFTLTVGPDRPAIVRFTPDSVLMDAVGDSVKLTPTFTDQYANATTVLPTFSVDSANIAGLTAGAYVKSLRNGRATVTATADTAKGWIRVIVKQAVTALDLTPASPAPFASLGDTLAFHTVARDRLGSIVPGARPVYRSSDTSVVSVDTLGRVTATNNGSAYVTVSVADAGARDSSLVTVQQVAASLALTMIPTQVAAGDSVRLTAVVKDARGATIVDAPVTYASSADSVADVTPAGWVRAKKVGSVMITASSASATATLTSSVIPGAPATVTVSPTIATLASFGATTTLSALVKDARGNAVGTRVTWSSSAAVATVDSNGTVTAAANGTAWIRAVAGNARDSAQLTVQQVVSTVALSRDSLALVVGDTSTLVATAKDARGATVATATYTWVSRDTAIATVSVAGTVTARSAGQAWIVVTSGSASDSLRVRGSYSDAGCVQGAITVADTVTGVWAVNDCVTDAAIPYDRYALTVTAQAHFRATVTGPAGRKLLMRHGSATGPYIAYMPRAIADTMNPIVIDYLLAPGTYVLEVQAPAAGARGSYSLRTSAVNSISCDALTWATPNVEVTGGLATGDCLVDGVFEDYLVVKVPTGRRLKASLTSSGFRPVIAIKDDHSLASPLLSREHRNTSGSVSTSWTTRYDDATHAIIATTYAAAETGTYTLRLDEIDATNTCGVEPVVRGEDVMAAWEITDCTDSTGKAYDAFAPAPATGLRVSTLGPAGRYLQVLVDGQSAGRQTSADTAVYVSQWFLRPGTTTVRVGAPDGGGGSGYTAGFGADTNITNCRWTWAQRGATLPAQRLQTTDCTYGARYQDRLLVRIDSGTTFSTSMDASFAPSIVLRNANTAPDQVLLVRSDSVPGLLVVTWTATFSGVYEIIFTSNGTGITGAYTPALPMSVGAVAVTPDSVSLQIGDTTTASAAVTDTENNPWPGSVSWLSRDTLVARVNATGRITAVSAGTTRIVASAESQADSVVVTVTSTEAPVASVEVAPDTLPLMVNDTASFAATLRDAGNNVLGGRSVAWSSADTTVAGVTTSGLVTARAAGAVWVTATSEGVSDSGYVVVSPPAVASVRIAPDSANLIVGDTVRLNATLLSAGGDTLTGRSITWTSSDTALARVDTLGLVTALAAGRPVITAEREGVSDTVTVAIMPPPVVTVQIVPDSTDAFVGGQRQLQVVTLAANGDTLAGRATAWSSLTPGIATVDSTGAVTGVSPGMARIVAASEGRADTAKVIVRSPVTRIVIAPDSTTLTSLGATQMLSAVAYDTANVVMTGVNFTWSVANPLVASLSSTTGENVTTTAEGAGVTQVFASALGQTGSGVIRVGQFAATIHTAPDTVYVTVNGRATLTADVRDANNAQIAGAQPVWRRSNSVFSIDTLTGAVTGTSLGTGHAWAELDGVTSDSVYVVVTSSAPPAIAFGSRTFTVGKTTSIQVPVYLSTAPTSNVVVRLTSSDTAKAKFSAPTVTFGPGTTQVNATLFGQSTGNVTLIATDSAGVFRADTVSTQVQIAVTLEFPRISANGIYYNAHYMSVPDTFPGRLRLSDPAPAGGLYFTIDGMGYVQPSQTTLYIPAGNLAADVSIAGKTPGSNFWITASANGVAAGSFYMAAVYPGTLSITNPTQNGGSARHFYVARGQEVAYGPSVRTPAKVAQGVNLTIASPDPAIAVALPATARIGVDSQTYTLRIRGNAVGEAPFTAAAAGWTSASDTIVVTSPKLKAIVFWGRFGDTTNIYPYSRAPNLNVQFTDSLGNAGETIDSLRFTIRSSDSTVLRAVTTAATILPGSSSASGIQIVPMGAGTAWVYFEGTGLLSDSLHVTVRRPKINLNAGNTLTSVGLRSGNVSISLPGASRDTVTVNLTSSDSTVVAVDSAYRINPFEEYSGGTAAVSSRGRGFGTATIIASAPGLDPDTVVLTTATPRIFVHSYPTRVFGNLADTLRLPAFGERDIAFTVQDSIRSNTTQEFIDDVVFSFSVDDTTIASIDSLAVTRGANRCCTNPGKIHAIGGGMTWLRVTAPGFLPDSFRIVVDAAPLNATLGSSQRLAPYQHSSGGSYDSYVTIPNARSTPVIVRVSNVNPAVIALDSDSIVIPAGQVSASVGWGGTAIGVDTVTFSAAGYAPDTVIYTVEQGRLRHDVGGGIRNTYYTTSPPQPRSFGLQTVTTMSNAVSTRTEVIRIVSTNPAVLVPDSEYVHVAAGVRYPSYRFSIVGPGTARFVMTDSLGAYVGDTSVAITVTAPPINFANYGMSMGMRQQTLIVNGNPQEWVSVQDTVRGASRTVYLASSDTSVATVPDSVVIPVGQVGAWYTITTHDTVGVIAITANSTGHLQGRFDLTVTRGALEFSTASSIAATNTTPQAVNVALRDSLTLYRTQRSTEPVVLTLTSSSPGVIAVDSATFTVPAGVSGYHAVPNAWHVVGAGSATLTLRDERTGFVYYIQKSQGVTVTP